MNASGANGINGALLLLSPICVEPKTRISTARTTNEITEINDK